MTLLGLMNHGSKQPLCHHNRSNDARDATKQAVGPCDARSPED